MAKISRSMERALLIGGGATGVGIAALAGKNAGKKAGKTEVTKKFKEYNKKENRAIASRFYRAGVQAGHIDKQAELESIYTDAFNDEMSKVAYDWGSTTKTLYKSLKGSGKFEDKAKSAYHFIKKNYKGLAKDALPVAGIGAGGIMIGKSLKD